jgi:hypothetical protein
MDDGIGRYFASRHSSDAPATGLTNQQRHQIMYCLALSLPNTTSGPSLSTKGRHVQCLQRH